MEQFFLINDCCCICGDLLYKYALDLYAIGRGTSLALKSHIMTMLMIFLHTSVFFVEHNLLNVRAFLRIDAPGMGNRYLAMF